MRDHGDMMTRLELAKGGDQQAKREVVEYVFRTYRRRCERFYTIDPAIGRDDIEAAFMEGIIEGLAIIDERGDPLYHLGQRGWWAVSSLVRAAKCRTDKRVWPRGPRFEDAEGEWSVEHQADPSVPDVREVVVERADAATLVRIVANASLSSKEREIMDLVLSGEVDPDEEGFGRVVAERLGISPQRVSQLMAKLEGAFRRAAEGASPLPRMYDGDNGSWPSALPEGQRWHQGPLTVDGA